jgi:hypothetical protein
VDSGLARDLQLSPRRGQGGQMKLLRIPIVVLLSLPMAACFWSQAPLIAPSTASYPFQNGAKFVRVLYAEEEEDERRPAVVSIGFGYYTYAETYTDDEDGQRKTSRSRGLLKEITPGAYVVMMEGEKGGYEYLLLKRDGNAFDLYSLEESDLFPKKCADFRAASERSDAYDFSFDCRFSSFDDLKQAALFILNGNKAYPDSRLEPQS